MAKNNTDLKPLEPRDHGVKITSAILALFFLAYLFTYLSRGTLTSTDVRIIGLLAGFANFIQAAAILGMLLAWGLERWYKSSGVRGALWSKHTAICYKYFLWFIACVWFGHFLFYSGLKISIIADSVFVLHHGSQVSVHLWDETMLRDTLRWILVKDAACLVVVSMAVHHIILCLKLR